MTRKFLIVIAVLVVLGWHFVGKRYGADMFKSLPMENAITITHGQGTRQLVVFEDPNCGYCKQLEQGLQNIDDVTVHVFLLPILGTDSTIKSNRVWCSSDQAEVWQDWMVRGEAPADSDSDSADCDVSALEANRQLARKYGIRGTPALMFADGTVIPGELEWHEIERRLK
jgi:thiol:disulfide interchange protein DsbC